MYKGLIEKYREYLPIESNEVIISLCEGQTKLIRASNLEIMLPGLEIYLKFDGLNPTGSFKDRGMTMAVTKAFNSSSKAVICASTGNTSASMAAYAAKAGMKSFMLIPDGKIAMGKLAQAVAYGAEIVPISGNFDEALEMVQAFSKEHPVTMVNSINPFRIEGQKTAAFEVCDDLLDAPDYLMIPVGNAGNITAYWKGFKEYYSLNKTTQCPSLFGFQAEGSAPLVNGMKIDHPETIATAIRIGNPASWTAAETALTESKGKIQAISDALILKYQRLLASTEGIFAEPASCISVAGLFHAYENKQLLPNSRVVCVLTGNGLKDTDIILSKDFVLPTVKTSFSEVKAQLLGGIMR